LRQKIPWSFPIPRKYSNININRSNEDQQQTSLLGTDHIFRTDATSTTNVLTATARAFTKGNPSSTKAGNVNINGTQSSAKVTSSIRKVTTCSPTTSSIRRTSPTIRPNFSPQNFHYRRKFFPPETRSANIRGTPFYAKAEFVTTKVPLEKEILLS
jgi:hypothetical protein